LGTGELPFLKTQVYIQKTAKTVAITGETTCPALPAEYPSTHQKTKRCRLFVVKSEPRSELASEIDFNQLLEQFLNL
jgi:hypothetical protein